MNEEVEVKQRHRLDREMVEVDQRHHLDRERVEVGQRHRLNKKNRRNTGRGQKTRTIAKSAHA